MRRSTVTVINMDFASLMWAAALLVSICSGQDPPVDEVVGFKVTINGGDNSLLDVGEAKAYACKVTPDTDSGQFPELKWYRDNIPVTTTAIADRIYTELLREDTLLLRFTSVEDEDRGIYKCEATLGTQSLSSSVEVETYQKMEIQSPVQQSGQLGKDGEVHCKVKANPPPFRTWKFGNNTRIPANDKYVMSGSTLTIKDLTFADKGEYKCDLFVERTTDVDKLVVDFDVYETPEILLPLSIQPNNPKVGDEVKIHCTATGTPQPTYQFKRGENQISDSEEQTVDSNTGVLTLKSVTRLSEGSYTCIANNIGGTADKETTLDVKIPPTITEITSVDAASEDQEVVVNCVAEGDPAPTLTWEKVGQAPYTPETADGPVMEDVPSSDLETAEIKTVGKKMRFNMIRPADAGTYMCKAISNVGTVNKTTTIEVKYKPHFNTDYKTTTYYGWKGHRANLTCMASANDLAVFQWYMVPADQDQMDYSAGDMISGTDSATYTVESLQRFPEYHLSSSSLMVSINGDDSSVYRQYTCVASNGESTAHVVELREANAPARPVVRFISSLSTMVTLQVDKPSDGGQPVNGFTYKYYASADDEVDGLIKEQDIQGDSTTFNINNLKPSTTYTFKMAATNAVGTGDFGEITFDTQAVSKPLKLEMTSGKDGLDANSYTVEWGNVEDGGAVITKYIIKYRRIEVSNPDATSAEWTISGDLDTEYTTKELVNQPGARRYKISGLSSNAFYDVRIFAVNKEGESDVEFNIIKTSAGTGGVRDSSPGQLASSLATLLLLLATACLATLDRC